MRNLYFLSLVLLSFSFISREAIAGETLNCVSRQSPTDRLALVVGEKTLTLISSYPSSPNVVATLSNPNVYEFAYDQLGCGRGATLSFNESAAPNGATILSAYLSIPGNYECAGSETYYTCKKQ